MSDWKTFGTAGELDRALAVHIAEGLRRDIDSRGSASLAVSGGSTPKHMFELLSACELDWSRVWITLVDERWVSTSSEDSNERLLRENLLQHSAAAAQLTGIPPPGSRWRRICGNCWTPEIPTWWPRATR
jgi:6-phosphogluconolactonase